MKRRHFVLTGGAMAAGALLSACGGGSSSSSASYRFRVINASPDFASLDLYVDGTATLSATAYGTASSYASSADTSVSISLASAGSASYALTSSQSFSTGYDYTIVAYGCSSNLKMISFLDTQTAASSGETTFRVIHTASDAGAVDVYLTTETATLDASTPLWSSLAAGSIATYATVKAGTYRVRIVGAGNTADVRLDISGVTLASTDVVSLITVPGSSGVLLKALLAPQGGTVTALTTALARVRVVASVAGNATVQATVGNTEVLAAVRSPSIGSYVTVPSGSPAMAVTVDGVAVTVPATTLAVGSDTTLVVSGPAASPVVTVVTDDNRLPKSSAACKIRLIHAAQQLASSQLGLTVNYTSLATGIARGAASAFSEITASTSALLDVQDPLTLASAYSASGVTLTAGAVYSVFMLTGNPSAGGILRRER